MSVFENHDPESLIDTLVDGRFRLRTEISRSGSSTVFVAEDQRDGSEVAVRLFSADVSGRRGEALLDQARAAAEMSHPNVVRTTGFGRTTVAGVSRVYVAQERLTGGTLQDMLDRGRLLTPSQALAVGVDVCRALDYAHKRGLTHFDLRPSAIVFGDDRRARVADLGVASVVSEDAWADTTTVSLERARYCAPEQATGEMSDAPIRSSDRGRPTWGAHSFKPRRRCPAPRRCRSCPRRSSTEIARETSRDLSRPHPLLQRRFRLPRERWRSSTVSPT
ncbi:MAG: hypothetical protein EBY07_10645 [Actinobacteria bacterium]|nr:hypothetical protein [Actinomycetota bacterium]